MKRAITAMLCSLLVSAPAFAQYKAETDRFTGISKWFYNSPRDVEPMILVGVIKDPGRPALRRMTLFTTNYSRHGSSWKYLRCHSVAFLVDGKPLGTASAKHDGQTMTRGVIENISVDLELSDLETMAAASSIEYRICNDEFQMTPEDLAGIRQVAEGSRGP